MGGGSRYIGDASWVLEREGLSAGEVEASVPHAHNYHAEFDEAERAMAQALDWRIDELREEDQQ